MYDETKAEKYWSTRVQETDQLAAVLSFGLPAYINEAYSKWEIGLVLGAVLDWAGLQVLDIGCGVGRVTIPLALAGARVTALDNAAKMLELCGENAATAGVRDSVELVKSSASKLGFPGGTFDVVCCLGVLEHLPAEVRQSALDEMVRVVRPEGLLLLVVNSTESVLLKREALYHMTAQQDTGYHVSLIGKETITRFLEDRGFTIESLGSNLFQSLAKHAIRPFLPTDGSEEVLTSLLNLTAELDLSFRSKGDLDRAFADQYVLRAHRSER